MLLYKIAPVFLLAIAVGAEKKIELQDIEEDNLKSENDKDFDKVDSRTENQGSGLLPLEFLKNGLLRYFESPTHTQQAQQPRYVQQYAVTEAPERPQQQPTAQPKTQYGPPTAQQAMVGYLSNVPMQIYLVPQYYNDQSEQAGHSQAVHSQAVQYTAPARVAYPTAPEAVQTQTNYIEVPTYITPTTKTFVQQYAPPVAYVSYTAQPTVPTHTQATVAYQMPVQVQYPTAIVAPPVSKGYYQNTQYTETNSVDDGQENDEDRKQYTAQTEAPYTKTQAEYPRNYYSRQPLREDYRHSSVSELPPPNPLLLKNPPPHLSHIPKALPMYRPLNKPVYGASGFIPNYTQRPHEVYGVPFKRRPTSLLDSYIPSSLQYEYLRRGYHKDPLQLYEALSSSRHIHHGHPPVTPRHYERGFLPNQMYHTASGGVTFGHYKRSPPKVDKSAK